MNERFKKQRRIRCHIATKYCSLSFLHTFISIIMQNLFCRIVRISLKWFLCQPFIVHFNYSIIANKKFLLKTEGDNTDGLLNFYCAYINELIYYWNCWTIELILSKLCYLIDTPIILYLLHVLLPLDVSLPSKKHSKSFKDFHIFKGFKRCRQHISYYLLIGDLFVDNRSVSWLNIFRKKKAF